MSVNIVRAWSDPEYRDGLTVGQLASVPANPAASGELSQEELLGISGGGYPPAPTCWYAGLVETWARLA